MGELNLEEDSDEILPLLLGDVYDETTVNEKDNCQKLTKSDSPWSVIPVTGTVTCTMNNAFRMVTP